MTTTELADKILKLLPSMGLNHTIPQFSDVGADTNITLPTDKNRAYEGMQINYDDGTGEFEVSEYMAGKDENELHIFTRTTSLKRALKSLYRGNKKRKIIEKII